MATAESIPAPDGALTHEPAEPAAAAEAVGAEELPQEESALLRRNPAAARLPVELDVSVAVTEFRVRDLLSLEPGQVIESRWTHGQDMPLAAGRIQLAWSEFEVVDTTIAVRITRLI